MLRDSIRVGFQVPLLVGRALRAISTPPSACSLPNPGTPTPTKILVGPTKHCCNRQKHQRRLQKPHTHHNLHNRILPELQKRVQPQKNLAMEAIPQIRPIRSHPRLNLRDSLLPPMESNSHQLHRLPFQPLRCSSCPTPTHSQLEKWLHQKFEVKKTLFPFKKKKKA
jgi:hypothetical protein